MSFGQLPENGQVPLRLLAFFNPNRIDESLLKESTLQVESPNLVLAMCIPMSPPAVYVIPLTESPSVTILKVYQNIRSTSPKWRTAPFSSSKLQTIRNFEDSWKAMRQCWTLWSSNGAQRWHLQTRRRIFLWEYRFRAPCPVDAVVRLITHHADIHRHMVGYFI